MNKILKHFDFLIDQRYFLGYRVTKPFYVLVQYEHLPVVNQVTVTNLAFPFNAFPALCVNYHLLQEIEEAAKQNALYEPKNVVEIAEEVHR